MLITDRVNKYGFNFILNYDEDDSYRLGQFVVSGEYEKYEAEVFLSCLKRDSVFIDIGANIGFYTLLASYALKRHWFTGSFFGNKVKCQVHAFEPGSRNFYLLNKNILDNRLENVCLYNMAIADQSGEAKLYLSDENRGDHRLYNSHDYRPAERCLKTTIDIFCEEMNISPTIIKTDTQGYDYFVLVGMSKILASGLPLVLLTEFWPYGSNLVGVSARDHFLLLRKHFRTIRQIDENTKTLKALNYDEIMAICAEHNGFNHVNLICTR